MMLEEAPNGFSAGDAVVLWQSAFDVARLADDGPLLGSVFTTRVASVSGMQIVLAELPPWPVARGAQLVRVIEASELRIESGEDWYIEHFDGTKHGMLAIFVRGEARIDGDIVITGGGYGRGESTFTAERPVCGDPLAGADVAGRGGGGAFFYTPSPCGAEYGCGADPLALGGAAAQVFGMGAGGGGNAGAGGPAYTSFECMPAARVAGGGSAGIIRDNALYLGGGGGAASLLDSPASLAGGDGGGVILIRAMRVLGGGGIIADGDYGDGGGGGAGGTIAIQSAGESICSLYARGGSALDYSGAGGGGRIIVYGEGTGCLTDEHVAGGDTPMPGSIAGHGLIETFPPLSCVRCAAAGLLCDAGSLACAPCLGDGECAGFGPSFACGVDGICYDACAGLCAADQLCVPAPGGGYECASTGGCRTDDECRLALCDVAMNLCVPGACRVTEDCREGSRCDPDPAHPGLGECIRVITPPDPVPSPRDQFTFSGGGGCSTAGSSELAWIAILLLGLRRRR
jgi:hypothetical protein